MLIIQPVYTETVPIQRVKGILDTLYDSYNRRRFVSPDPLEFLYHYNERSDREIVGLLASSLAYGKVSQIVKSISFVLERMTPSPCRFLENASPESLSDTYRPFKHRFTTGDELAAMLLGMKKVIMKYGSLHNCFTSALSDDSETIIPAISAFVKELKSADHQKSTSLLPLPAKGSACKRLNLFLRWMVRCDEVDPGGWSDISPSKLLIPLDTHMHRICLKLGLTRRKQADIKTAIEITDAFRTIVPHDPVRYDFALTRLGIRQETDITSFLNKCNTITTA